MHWCVDLTSYVHSVEQGFDPEVVSELRGFDPERVLMYLL